MLRITHYLKDLQNPIFKLPPKPKAPVVIWNLIRRCNLTCKHCYSISADKDFPNELSTEQVFKTLEDLKQYGVSVLILSGGEPLLRKDIFEISQRAKEMGFYIGLSTNGTLIDENNIENIAKMNYDYVGISLDGIEETHDKFRRLKGAYKSSLNAVRLCKENGIKIGIRFTLTQDNQHDFNAVLNLLETETIEQILFIAFELCGAGK